MGDPAQVLLDFGAAFLADFLDGSRPVARVDSALNL
jgi:hypothetical protein